MTLTDFFNGTGRVFQKSFEWIEGLANTPNVLIIIAITVSVCVWVWMMAKYNREAEEKGTLK